MADWTDSGRLLVVSVDDEPDGAGRYFVTGLHQNCAGKLIAHITGRFSDPKAETTTYKRLTDDPEPSSPWFFKGNGVLAVAVLVQLVQKAGGQ
jgi:hypothetical protein